MSTKIEWTDKTWNPVRGCTKVSSGCDNCYAMGVAHRFSGPGQPYEGLTRKLSGRPQWNGKIRLVPEKLTDPLRWRKPSMVFVNSMSDLFHPDVPADFIAEVFGVMAVCANGFMDGRNMSSARYGPHIFQLLTKRPERMRKLLCSQSFRSSVADAAYKHAHNRTDAGHLAHQIGSERQGARFYEPGGMWPLPNVWLGVSAEDQQRANERIPLLMQTPAAVRWVSAEPLLGPIDFNDMEPEPGWFVSLLSHEDFAGSPEMENSPWGESLIDWIVVGGESGNGARDCYHEWISRIVADCEVFGIPVFVKQLGACYSSITGIAGKSTNIPAPLLARRLSDAKGGDMEEWPESLRVRQWPEVLECP